MITFTEPEIQVMPLIVEDVITTSIEKPELDDNMPPVG